MFFINYGILNNKFLKLRLLHEGPPVLFFGSKLGDAYVAEDSESTVVSHVYVVQLSLVGLLKGVYYELDVM